MRRLMYLLILVLFVSISATCVNASTDCERWFKTYREQLVHARQLQRIAAAKRRAQRKLAGYVPKPKPATVVKPGPRMTRRQTVHHFDLACGALPEDESEDGVFIAEETPPPPFESHFLDDRLDTEPAGLDQMISENAPPPFDGGDSAPPSGGYPNYGPPVGGGGPPSGGGPKGGGTTVPPTNPVPPTIPDTPVPEPGSLVLVLTGAAGAAGVLRRRFRA